MGDMLVGGDLRKQVLRQRLITLVTGSSQKADTAATQYNPDGDNSVPRLCLPSRIRQTSVAHLFSPRKPAGNLGEEAADE